MSEHAPPPKTKKKRSALAQILLRGLAISLPTILTIVILIWLVRGVNTYIIYPATSAVKWVTAKVIDDSVPTDHLVELKNRPNLEYCGRDYVVTERLEQEFIAPKHEDEPPRDAEWLIARHLVVPGIYVRFGRSAVPYDDYLTLATSISEADMPTSATGIYMEIAARRYFGQVFHLTLVAISLILISLYFLGRLVNVKLGKWFVAKIETNILGRVPVVKNVYGSVKQVTDFLFTESEIEYRRVVAVEYPRRGIWSLAFVTGESMLDIHTAVGEPCVAILIPTSPMPMTGYTMSLPKSEVLDLNLTVEEAMQFIISCGVLTAPHQRVPSRLLEQQVHAQLDSAAKSGAAERGAPALVSDSTSRKVGGCSTDGHDHGATPQT